MKMTESSVKRYFKAIDIVRYGLTTQGSHFDGFCAFYFIEEQTIARRVVVTKMVIIEID